MISKYIDFRIFLISLAVGVLLVYLYQPTPTVIYVYPTPDNLIRIGAMEELQNSFPDAVVGLSDHSIDNLACLGAVACGASILERHFTDSKRRSGPDIVCSMDIKECSELITQSKRMAKMRGGKKEAAIEERVTSDFAYASVVTIEDIKEGEVFSDKNIWVKRPGTGEFLADDYESLIGKISAASIPILSVLHRKYWISIVLLACCANQARPIKASSPFSRI